MHHFFIAPSAVSEGMVRLSGADGHHLKNVLRAVPGEEVLLSDGCGTDYLCEVAELKEQEVLLRIRFQEALHELPVEIYLFQALPKADRMELVVQKAVELGVHAIVPMETRHVVVRLDEKKREAKRRRWQAVAEAAAKQSKRSIVPAVMPVTRWRDALSMSAGFSMRLWPYENAEGMAATEEALRDLRALSHRAMDEKGAAPARTALFIGPEGGFSPEEAEDAVRAGLRPLSLGKRILRTETAAICAMSLLMFAAETGNAGEAPLQMPI